MSANIFGALVKPLVRTKLVWGVRSSNLDPKDLGRAERLFCWLGGALSRFSPDLIVSNSWAGLKHAQSDGFPAHRSMVIPNGFNTEHFRPDPEARRRVREELGVAESETLVGIVGRLHPMKDHATFLKAAGLLARTRPDLRFACIGPGCTTEANDLTAIANELGLGGKIAWVGPRNDMACIYNALDLLVSSSAYGEGFPNVLGEAMACGTPCVATNVGDSALVLGDAGEVSPPDDPEALHAAAARMLNRIAAGEVTPERVRSRIVDHFSLPRLLDMTEAALLQLCGRRDGQMIQLTYRKILIALVAATLQSYMLVFLMEKGWISFTVTHSILALGAASLPFLIRLPGRDWPWGVTLWCIGFLAVTLVYLLRVSHGFESGLQLLRSRILAGFFLMTVLLILSDRRTHRFAAWTMVVASLIAVALNLYEVFAPGTFSDIPGRSAGLYRNANTSGAALVMGMIVGLYVVGQKWQVPYALAIGLGILVTSRGPRLWRGSYYSAHPLAAPRGAKADPVSDRRGTRSLPTFPGGPILNSQNVRGQRSDDSRCRGPGLHGGRGRFGRLPAYQRSTGS